MASYTWLTMEAFKNCKLRLRTGTGRLASMIRKTANTSQVFPKCRQLSLLVFGLIACFLFSVVAVSASAKSVNLEEVIRAVLQRSLNVEQ